MNAYVGSFSVSARHVSVLAFSRLRLKIFHILDVDIGESESMGK